MSASLNSVKYHIIDVDLQVGEDNIHEALIGCACVLEAEGHDILVVVIMV